MGTSAVGTSDLEAHKLALCQYSASREHPAFHCSLISLDIDWHSSTCTARLKTGWISSQHTSAHQSTLQLHDLNRVFLELNDGRSNIRQATRNLGPPSHAYNEHDGPKRHRL